MDADNIARPDMVERFVKAIHPRPELGVATCFFLAFRNNGDIARNAFAYAYRPTGGPHVLASMRNVYGDATAIYRVSAFRSIGGYETDRDTSYEDWEAFVKLVNGGWLLDVVPEHLFYYRHLATGFSRTTSCAPQSPPCATAICANADPLPGRGGDAVAGAAGSGDGSRNSRRIKYSACATESWTASTPLADSPLSSCAH